MKHAFLSLFPLSHRFGIERDDVSPRPGEELRGERDVVDRVSRLVVVAFRELRTRDADEEERKEEKEDASAAGHSSKYFWGNGKRFEHFYIVRKPLLKERLGHLFVERERESKREKERERRGETGEGFIQRMNCARFEPKKKKKKKKKKKGKNPLASSFIFPPLSLSLSLESTHAREKDARESDRFFRVSVHPEW